jgi:hypothetical protein
MTVKITCNLIAATRMFETYHKCQPQTPVRVRTKNSGTTRALESAMNFVKKLDICISAFEQSCVDSFYICNKRKRCTNDAICKN